MISLKILNDFRAETYRLHPAKRLKSVDDAIEFVNRRGFVFFWPIKGLNFPSLWVATAGDRPVADQHDDPGHITWRWKDNMLGKRAWYYAKILRKKATMVALDSLPYFYALSENYGSPEEDHLTLYEQGRLTLEAKAVYGAILEEGPLDTISLKKASKLSNKESDSRFNKAITDLQADFKITPIRVAQAGAWKYAFVYEITARYYPDLIEKARGIPEKDARQKLLMLFFQSQGAARLADITKLFSWRPNTATRAVESLIDTGFLREEVKIESLPGEWLVLSKLAES